jgi:hypothetical protein
MKLIKNFWIELGENLVTRAVRPQLSWGEKAVKCFYKEPEDKATRWVGPGNRYSLVRRPS